MEKKVHFSLLLGFYGPLLTERQREAMELYCAEDYSLSEIAEQKNITRQGVRDALVRAEQVLESTEQKLGLAERYMTLREGLEEICVSLQKQGNTLETQRIHALLAAWEGE